jgi:hypothetical protein
LKLTVENKKRRNLMAIEVHFPDDFLTENEKNKLMKLLGCENDDEKFAIDITKIAQASLCEYKDMLLGMGMPTRADEIRQYRLLHLIKNYFIDRLPSEAEVSSMFQLTQSKSKSLIQNAITRFRYQLENEIRNTLINNLKQAEFDKDANEYHLVIQSGNVLEELNRIIATIAPELDPIRKIRNMSRSYSISEDSFDKLKEYFDFE